MKANTVLAVMPLEAAQAIRRDYGLLKTIIAYFASAAISAHPEAVLDHLLKSLIIEHLGEQSWDKLSLPRNAYHMRCLKSTMCTALSYGQLPGARDFQYVLKEIK